MRHENTRAQKLRLPHEARKPRHTRSTHCTRAREAQEQVEHEVGEVKGHARQGTREVQGLEGKGDGPRE